MAAQAPFVLETAFEPLNPAVTPLAKLAAVHAEAVETARLANLLGRSLHAMIAFGALAVLVLVLEGALTTPAIAWAFLTFAGIFAMARAYRHAIGQPFERASLHAFAQDLRACLLYAGFAWGAGAFLALSEATPGLAALLYVGAPAGVFALLLRERQAVVLFLAPAAATSALACAMRPFSDGAVAAAIVLVASAILAWAVHAMTRGETVLAFPRARTAA